MAFITLASAGVWAEDGPTAGPRIGLIIDDMGNQFWYGQEALALPGAVTYSFLPHTPYAPELAHRAHLLEKEVMLHLPMTAVSGERLGPGALTPELSEEEFRARLEDAIQSIPHVAGLNNHMGSLLTSRRDAMIWLMEGIRASGDLYFVDSRTTTETVAERIAEETGIPSIRRDVFLDNERDPEVIRRQVRRLAELAMERGSAVGIGHPYPETIEVLSEELRRLEAQGIRLVPLSQLAQTDWRKKPWHESSSLLPKVVKN